MYFPEETLYTWTVSLAGQWPPWFLRAGVFEIRGTLFGAPFEGILFYVA